METGLDLSKAVNGARHSPQPMKLVLGAALWGTRAAAFRDRAAALESLGYGSLSVGDHLGHFPPLTACAAIAEGTATARLGPLVLNNDLRHPVVLAREAAALFDLSAGRFELGLGAGYAGREYDRAGIAYAPAAIRIARLAEAVHVLRRLFSEEEVTFDGRYYRVREDSLRALRRPVPLLVGGNSADVHAIAARDADIVNFTGLSPTRGGTVEEMSDFTTDALGRQVRTLDTAERGLDTPLEHHVLVQWHEVTRDRAAAASRAAAALNVAPDVVLESPYALIGTPEEIAAQLDRHNREFGITRWTVFADRDDLQPADALAPVIDVLRSTGD